MTEFPELQRKGLRGARLKMHIVHNTAEHLTACGLELRGGDKYRPPTLTSALTIQQLCAGSACLACLRELTNLLGDVGEPDDQKGSSRS